MLQTPGRSRACPTTRPRLGCEADWLVRVETGFAAAGPEEVARILVEYGVREAAAADTMIDMARRRPRRLRLPRTPPG
jgi:hypothetical protein